MLELVTATGFLGELGSGRTLPVRLEAERSDGTVIEVVAKLSATECGLGGLVREAMAAMLAADLGLPVPEPFLVDFPVSFVETVPAQFQAAAQRIADSISPTFGSRYLHGLFAYPHELAMPAELVDTAAEIVVFDGVCRNQDRWSGRPNCLTDRSSRLVMIDHELALVEDPLLGSAFNPYPWRTGGMDPLIKSERPHILLAKVKGKGAKIDRLRQSWAKITPDRLQGYVLAIPPGWDVTGSISKAIREYLEEVLSNIDGAFEEAGRVLQ